MAVNIIHLEEKERGKERRKKTKAKKKKSRKKKENYGRTAPWYRVYHHHYIQNFST